MNVNRGLPKGFEQHLVAQHFPPERPIFWGPNQSTLYPDIYNEPVGWRPQDIMKIPRVVRFITGGLSSPEAITRAIYLGRTKTHTAGIFSTSDATTGFNDIPTREYTKPSPPVGSSWPNYSYSTKGFTEWEAFEQVTDIATAYGANKSTGAVVGALINTVPVLRDVAAYFGTNWYGPQSSFWTWLVGNPGVGTQYKENQGVKAGATVTNSGGLHWDEFGSIDTNGTNYNELEWWGIQQDFRGPNVNKVTREDPLPFRVPPDYYWFLVNTIAGALEDQTNYLVLCSGDFSDPLKDLDPSSGDWFMIEGLAIVRSGNPEFSRVVEGLILQP